MKEGVFDNWKKCVKRNILYCMCCCSFVLKTCFLLLWFNWNVSLFLNRAFLFKIKCWWFFQGWYGPIKDIGGFTHSLIVAISSHRYNFYSIPHQQRLGNWGQIIKGFRSVAWRPSLFSFRDCLRLQHFFIPFLIRHQHNSWSSIGGIMKPPPLIGITLYPRVRTLNWVQRCPYSLLMLRLSNYPQFPWHNYRQTRWLSRCCHYFG